MEFRTERLLLRELRPEDFDAMLEIASFPQVHTYEHQPISMEVEVRSYLERALQWVGGEPRTHYRLAITLPPSERMRGRMGLTLNWSEIHEWEIGWQLHYLEWGKGYATEAARGLLGFAFRELKAHRVVAYCNVHNLRSVGVMERLGMQREAQLRETRWWQDTWTDEYVYAILEREFLQQDN